MSEEKRPSRMMLKTSLSETSHNHRRSLLAVSAIGIAIALTGLIPSKITTLGIEFSETNRSSLLIFLVCVVSYFLIAFLAYAIPDFVAWSSDLRESQLANFQALREKKRRQEERLAELSLADKPTFEEITEELYREEDVTANELSLDNPQWYWYLKAGFDFVLPLAVSVYAIIVLLVKR